MKNYISNILIIIFAIFVFLGIGFIIYRDSNSLQKHLSICRKQCYPAGVIEQFSARHCMCQPIIEDVNKE